mmetsp:Transcript_23944/g.36674  ORF Transcript_23944/g.36674 Transcript_23944/m.36674 type:complete len:92 (+) Transcript_23944:1648-1923(+)
MSIIVRNKATRKITMFTKGADVTMEPRIADTKYSEDMLERMDGFASIGLRTLMFAYKELDDDFEVPESDTVIEELENNLILIGITGLEDTL